MIKKIFIFCVRLYQCSADCFWALMGRNSYCIFVPTCSQYACECIEKNGVLKGTFFSLKRLLRCHPFNKGGLDFPQS